MRKSRLTPVIHDASRWRWVIGATVGAFVACLPGSTQTAVANGDTRTLNLYHAHTHESISATYLVDGQYDQAVLQKLNWFLRDWRRDEPTKMDPRLFDTVWEVHRESGSQQPIEVMSAYRSPETNAMLRRRSRQVAEHSQHILGKAMDQHYMDVPMSRIRELGMRLQRGGVGFYPTAGTPFVHLDVGGVRHWPRMSYDQLARLFPDGKTVHIPSNGQPLPGYEEARAELESRGDGSYPTATQLKSKGFFAWLFGGGGGDEDEDNAAAGVRSRKPAANQRVASSSPAMGAAADVGNYGNAARDRPNAVAFNAEPPRSLFGSWSQPQPAPPPPVAPAPPPEPVAPAPSAVAQQAFTASVPDAAMLRPAAPAPTLAPAIPSLPVVDPTFAPMPPRRPTELAALGPAAPLPPARPSDLVASIAPHDAQRGLSPGKSDAIGALLATNRMARLPDVITQGTGAPSKALGYAGAGPGTGVPLPVARPALLSTQLGRSNFRSLTRPESLERATGRSALGAALPPLRAATRSDLGAMTPDRAGKAPNFQPRASDLSTDRFSGPVVKPTAQVGGDKRSAVD